MPPVITYPDRTSSFFDIHAELPLGILKDYPYQEYTYTFSSGQAYSCIQTVSQKLKMQKEPFTQKNGCYRLSTKTGPNTPANFFRGL